jgi:hypothetical protein
LLRYGVDHLHGQEVDTLVMGRGMRLSTATVILLENTIARRCTLQTRFGNDRPDCVPTPKELDPSRVHQRDRVQDALGDLGVGSQELLHQGLQLGTGTI